MTGVPGAFKKVELSAFEKKISCFVVFLSYQMLSNVSFISMAIKKVFLTVQIATISNLSKTSTLWNHNYETVQPKIGQCVLDSVPFPESVHCGKKIGKYELFIHGPQFSSHSAHSQESAQS